MTSIQFVTDTGRMTVRLEEVKGVIERRNKDPVVLIGGVDPTIHGVVVHNTTYDQLIKLIFTGS